MDNYCTTPLLSGLKLSQHFSSERVPIYIAPEVRERLSALLYSGAYMGRGVAYSAFIDRACEAAESEYAMQKARKS